MTITHEHRYMECGYGPEDYDLRCCHCDCRPGGRWSIMSCGLVDEIAMFDTRPDWQEIIRRNPNEFSYGYTDANYAEWRYYQYADTHEGRVAYGLGRRAHAIRASLVTV